MTQDNLHEWDLKNPDERQALSDKMREAILDAVQPDARRLGLAEEETLQHLDQVIFRKALAGLVATLLSFTDGETNEIVVEEADYRRVARLLV